jgi:hypothetical protein
LIAEPSDFAITLKRTLLLKGVIEYERAGDLLAALPSSCTRNDLSPENSSKIE